MSAALDTMMTYHEYCTSPGPDPPRLTFSTGRRNQVSIKPSGKRAQWLVSTVAAMLVVSACGGAGATPAAVPSPTPAAVPSPTPAAVPSQKPVALKVMFWHDEPTWMNELKLFQEANPSIKVEYEAVPFGDYYAKVIAYIAAGDGPDTMGISPGWTNDFQAALQPVYDDLQDLIPKVNGTTSLCPNLDCSTNKYLGIPFSMQGFATYYNKQVLKDAGLDPEKPPATWRELADACDKIKAIGKTCFANGAKDFGDDILFGALSLNTVTEEEWRGYMSGKSKYTDPNFVNALRIYEDMGKRGWFSKTVLEDRMSPEAQTQFTSGEAAFFVGLIGDAYNWYSLGDVMGYKAFGATHFPSIDKDFPLEGVSPGPLAGTNPADSGGAFTIPTWSKQKEAALVWLRWWVSPEAQTRLARTGVYPTLKTVDTSTIDAPPLAQLVPLVNKAKVAGIGGWIPQKVMDELGVQWQLLLEGKTTPEQAAEKAQEAAAR
jgi:multiple sugar transport system substrate-binding protein